MKILDKIFDIINYKRIEDVEGIIKDVMQTELGFSNVNMNNKDQNYALSIRKIYKIIYCVSRRLYNKENK